ncbi:MAG: FMN-binding protein [Gemmatimonadetes bacterium]|nr:FMN-binding protein [Gemmatimonadota bacterium]
MSESDVRDDGQKQPLPTVEPEATSPDELEPGTADAEAGAEGAPGPGDFPEVEETSSFRLIATLAVAGALAGALLVFVFLWAQPQILAYRAMVLRESIQEVLKGPDHYETLFLYEGSFTNALPAGVDSAGLDRIYRGYDAQGTPVGVAVSGAEPGFADLINVIFGYDPGTRELLAMKVLEHKETPGLGDKIVKDTVFVGGFEGAVPPILGVKIGAGSGDTSEVDMITGVTISSRTIIDIINERLEELGELIERYENGGEG